MNVYRLLCNLMVLCISIKTSNVRSLAKIMENILHLTLLTLVYAIFQA